MFYHVKELQYRAKPERPDPVYAKKLQEILGGQFGEISVAMQYLFQGWNTSRGLEKYRDLLMDTGTEELAHIEMLSTMIARLLDKAPVKDQEHAAKNPVIEAIMGGMNPQHAIVSGLGAMPVNSVGVPWNAGYIVASGNLLADFRANLNAESQGRLQAVRLYEMTEDRGVKDMLSWLIARDTAHQNQWMAAIAELEAQEGRVVPNTFPRELQKQEVAYAFMNLSAGEESSTGRWASGKSMDSMGVFQYVQHPVPFAKKPTIPPAPPSLHNTPPMLK
ncbi:MULTISPECIES: manganese catalase family protein [Sutcliffiella]|uniref:Manganese catalase n=1 Tax=Sutcliffiella cohnii TaxID=33932 RepID=A0A223KR69_9BACI|nr:MULTISPECIES: manganese catalase family protein [Sutcliffiella]AST91838.1 manganese catalase [Sutcliffiella cohnii]MED4018650.1 manganese catalase family protein [Sutcliffiella cohnii]WBL13064.1 manganese catalase family protein [Sutcliffiella sp. NC1]